MTALGWVAFVVAGAVGAVARYAVHGWFLERAGADRPWGTFAVNVSGSFVLGVLTGLALHHGLPETSRVVLGAGFCGAFTTFSAFTVDTVRLLEDGAGRAAVANVVGTVVVGVGAAAAGLALASL
ncbi:MAG: fluoride exporter [Actinomycetota bacterium]|jgi:CrcB protein|nr:fluoride exporter [Actinomycetota bacterium]